MSADRWAAIEKWIGEARAYAAWRKRCGDDADAERWTDAFIEAQRVLFEERHQAELAKMRNVYEQKIADVDGIITDLIERHGRAFKNTADAFRETFAAVDDRVETVKSDIRKRERVALAKAATPRRKEVTYGPHGRIATVTEYEGDRPVLRKFVTWTKGRITNVREEAIP